MLKEMHQGREYKFVTNINGDVANSNLLLCLWRHKGDADSPVMQSSRSDQDSLSQEFQTVIDRKLSPKQIKQAIHDLLHYIISEIRNDGKGKVERLRRKQLSYEDETAEFEDIWKKFKHDLTVSSDFKKDAVLEIEHQIAMGNQELSPKFKASLMDEKNRLLNLISKLITEDDDEFFQRDLIRFMRSRVAGQVERTIRLSAAIENETKYFNYYYWPLFTDDKDAYLEKIYQQKVAPKGFKVSNLDILVDISNQDLANIVSVRQMRNYVIAADKGSELGNIILDRILDSNNNANLKIVMYSYLLLWKPLLKKCFQDRFQIDDETELEQKYRKACEPYLYEMTYRNRGLIAENIHPVGISDETYLGLKESIK